MEIPMLLSHLLQFLKLQRYRAQNWTERIGSPQAHAPNIGTSPFVPNFEESPQLDHIGLSWGVRGGMFWEVLAYLDCDMVAEVGQ
jgi:hypothetical protein